MVLGVKASTYINLFLTTYNELENLKGHEMNDQETKSLFLRNIHNPAYTTLKETLEINVITTPLRELVLNNRKKECAMARKANNVKRVQRLAGEMGLIKEESLPKRPRRTQGGEEKTVQGTHSLPPVINPNMEGIIKIHPSTTWYGLSEEDRTFVLNYNPAIRHNEKTPSPPKGSDHW